MVRVENSSSWERAKHQIENARRDLYLATFTVQDPEIEGETKKVFELKTTGLINLSDASWKLLENAHAQAEKTGSFAVLTEHVVIAAIMEENPEIDRVLGVSKENREEIINLFSEDAASYGSPPRKTPHSPLMHSQLLAALGRAHVKSTGINGITPIEILSALRRKQ